MASFRHVLAIFALAVHFGCGAPEKQADQQTVPSHRAAAGQQAGMKERSPALLEAEKKAGTGRHDAPAGRLAPGRVSMPLQQTAPATLASGPLADDTFARHVTTPENTEKYRHFDENPIKLASEQPVSTFSIDVDTGSYANVRRFLNEGRLPPHDAVRVEELINYFGYAYAPPAEGTRPFAVHTEMAPTPWNRDTRLLRIGIKGREIAKRALPPANLVFLIDVSGSMDPPNKLPLLKAAFRLLTDELRPQDKVSIVVYAGASGMVLEPTAGDNKSRILASLERLAAGGSTHGAAGIELAYRAAQQSFVPGGINRVLLATDGDFNVGVTNFEALKNLVENKRRSGISLSTLGFGTGNYNDQLMEQLADAGNGNYSYIDTLNEARKTLVDEFTSTLAVIAKDVKIQIEFNPALVAEYRLIGYENRALNREDFNNDKIDAGEIGAGHSVTALYEIRLHGQGKSLLDPLRYQDGSAPSGRSGELALLRLRHKAPEGDESALMEVPIQAKDIQALDSASTEFRFAAAVAAFGQELKGGKYLGRFGYGEIHRLANEARAEDPFGYRVEFLKLVVRAENLAGGKATAEDFVLAR